MDVHHLLLLLLETAVGTAPEKLRLGREAVLWVTASLCLRRLVELSSSVPIGSHWGVLSKCLAYSKAASDPFVYSLLRHQYRKSCKEILNRILHRRSLHSSGLTGDSHSQNILPVSE